MANKKPNLLVGIDVGMTCTGVAWAACNQTIVMTEAHVIQKWPGNSSRQSDKVPTVVCYKGGSLSSWGFLTNQEDHSNPSVSFHEWFKIYLDPEDYNKARQTDAAAVPKSHQDVRKFYRDFLRKLCSYIEEQLEDQVGRTTWRNAQIEFSFSVPTTWTAVGVTKDFEKLVREAGFGAGGPAHSVSVGLTEAEAAAVYTFKTQSASYTDGDILMIVDAGGGTTDLALLRVHQKVNELPKLQQLDRVRGDEIGSSMIDDAFHKLAESRLRYIRSSFRRSPDEVAWDMTRDHFQVHKEEFGTDNSNNQGLKKLVIPGLPEDFDYGTTIEGGKMIITNTDIQALFDMQLQKIYKLVDYQIGRMGEVAPQDQITHLVLSGGLGSSPYVKAQLRSRYVSTNSPSVYAKDLRILTSTLPQLAVVKGLVQDRLQKWDTGRPILTTRICRMSLGIVCNMLYDAKAHLGQSTYKDPADGKLYVKNQIVWLVKAGQSISQDSVDHDFFRLLLPKAPRSTWVSGVAISYNKASALPNDLRTDGAKILCNMKSDLTNVGLDRFEKKKKRAWQFWKSYKTHYIAKYKIKFHIKPAGIDFTLWFDGNEYKDPKLKSFEVDWEEGAQLSAPKEHLDVDRDWNGYR